MHLRIHDRRILAIDLRPRRFGYAVFEGSRFLLDWGANSYPSSGDPEGTVAAKRLAALLRFSTPSAVVVKKERWESAETDSVVRPVVEATTRETSARSIPIYLIGQNELASTFRSLECETKYEIASVLTRFFPELLWKLPPPRQIWESEHPRMTMFDAVAVGFTYWKRSSTESPPDLE
jgi:hypothetical protein